METQCIKYLEEDVHPIRKQSNDAISSLLTALKLYDLTKAERLQIINLAPVDLCHIMVVRHSFHFSSPSPYPD